MLSLVVYKLGTTEVSKPVISSGRFWFVGRMFGNYSTDCDKEEMLPNHAAITYRILKKLPHNCARVTRVRLVPNTWHRATARNKEVTQVLSLGGRGVTIPRRGTFLETFGEGVQILP